MAERLVRAEIRHARERRANGNRTVGGRPRQPRLWKVFHAYVATSQRLRFAYHPLLECLLKILRAADRRCDDQVVVLSEKGQGSVVAQTMAVSTLREYTPMGQRTAGR